MRGRILTAALSLLGTVALASSCPDGDAKLKNNSPLTSVCPNGFKGGSSGLPVDKAAVAEKDNVQMIYASAQNFGVPPQLALAVSYHESGGFRSCSVSFSGVKGPMMLTQKTARSLGYNRDINEQNINGGMKVLSDAYKSCSMNYACLASRYNGSTPGEQAQWAREVQKASNDIGGKPQVMANACNTVGDQACFKSDPLPTNPTSATASGGDPSAGSSPSLATIVPKPAPTDIVVGPGMAMRGSPSRREPA